MAPINSLCEACFTEDPGLLCLLLLAFGGGFILNVMPCVLPVISLKFLSLVKLKSHHAKKARLNLLAMALGVVVSFVVLAICMILLKYAGQHVGLGFNFQQPIFIIAVIIILILFALSIRGSLFIDLPSPWKNFLIRYSDESRLLGSFGSGAFATLLATPCTAPFIGTAISVAFTLGFVEIIIIFTAMGVGMSMPFVVFAAFPKLLNIIPKPGAWLHKFKKFLEILLYGTVLWLLWILYGQLGLWPAIVMFGMCVLLKFVIETKRKRIFLILVICGAFFMPLKLFKTDQKIEAVRDALWQTFTASKLAQHLDKGDLVLVNITADWCATCKYNQFVVLNNPFFLKFSAEQSLVLLKAEYTKQNKEAANFLDKYSRYGIPFTVLFSPKHRQGIILPTVLNYYEVIEIIKVQVQPSS